jgi:hypothetical protein
MHCRVARCGVLEPASFVAVVDSKTATQAGNALTAARSDLDAHALFATLPIHRPWSVLCFAFAHRRLAALEEGLE